MRVRVRVRVSVKFRIRVRVRVRVRVIFFNATTFIQYAVITGHPFFKPEP